MLLCAPMFDVLFAQKKKKEKRLGHTQDAEILLLCFEKKKSDCTQLIVEYDVLPWTKKKKKKKKEWTVAGHNLVISRNQAFWFSSGMEPRVTRLATVTTSCIAASQRNQAVDSSISHKSDFMHIHDGSFLCGG